MKASSEQRTEELASALALVGSVRKQPEGSPADN